MDRDIALQIVDRVRSRVSTTTDGCWVIKGTPTNQYPTLMIKARNITGDGKQQMFRVHRAMYVVWNGTLEEGACVLHSCDNRSCLNPQHLRAGSKRDNYRDVIERNRIDQDRRAARIRETWDRPDVRAHQSEVQKAAWRKRLSARASAAGYSHDTHKLCARCQQWKPRETGFHVCVGRYDGLQSVCKPCNAEKRRLCIETKRAKAKAHAAARHKSETEAAGVPEDFKRCRTCRQWLSRTSFYRSTHRGDGLTQVCKACSSTLCREANKKRKLESATVTDPAS